MSLISEDREDEEAESTKTPKKRSFFKRFLAFIVVLAAIAGGTAYLLERNGIDVRRVLTEARTSSEDAATTAAVKTAFALSSKVSAFAIDVATTNGVVRLDGMVPSESIRELAVAIAQDTAGVDDVEDRLEVQPATRPSPEIEQLKSQIADLEIRADLDSILLRNPELQGRDIRVSVKDRKVTLTGVLDTPELKRSVEQIARSVDNVVDVVNELTVMEPTEPAPAADLLVIDRDALIKQIRFELYATGAFNLDQMEIHTADGVVTLIGNVRSQAEKLLAERIVRDIEGVEDVSNELDVIAIPSRADATELAKRSMMHIIVQSGVI